jgi:hypothetical protein
MMNLDGTRLTKAEAAGYWVILLTNSENGARAFKPLLEKLFADTVTLWEWEGYPH